MWLTLALPRAAVVPRRFLAALSLLLAFLLSQQAQDARAANRIATLAPSLTELVYAAGAGEKLVGVSAYSDFPAEAKKFPIIADFAGANTEALLSLKPDLVLAWGGGSRPGDVARLRALGLRVEEVSISRLDEIAPAIQKIGVWADTAAIAAQRAAALTARISALQQGALKRISQPIATYIEVGQKPPRTVNGAHFISDIVTLCGGRNVFHDAPTLVTEPSLETLLQKNPAVVVYGVDASRGDQARDVSMYRGTTAYRDKRYVGVNADHLLRPGPRLVDAAEVVCGAMR
jgi:iron complex transport system substrate-binding protein